MSAHGTQQAGRAAAIFRLLPVRGHPFDRIDMSHAPNPDPSKGPRILVVDDDPELRSLLKQYLESHGFQVLLAADGPALWEQLAGASSQAPIDAFVLDQLLPGEDGLSLIRGLRGHYSQPILMLSSKGEDHDRIIGLEVGADDYLTKPFNPRELLARLRALLRRGAPIKATPSENRQESPLVDSNAGGAEPQVVTFGPHRLDLLRRTLHRDGEPMELTSGEFDLLALFARQPHRPLNRDALLIALKGYEHAPFDRSIDTAVSRLRRKLESDPSRPRFIRTLRAVGYLFDPSGGEAP